MPIKAAVVMAVLAILSLLAPMALAAPSEDELWIFCAKSYGYNELNADAEGKDLIVKLDKRLGFKGQDGQPAPNKSQRLKELNDAWTKLKTEKPDVVKSFISGHKGKWKEFAKSKVG